MKSTRVALRSRGQPSKSGEITANLLNKVVLDLSTRLLDRLDRLDEWPKRLPVDVVQTRLTGRETRKLNFGDYLVFYQVDDKHRQVNIVGFMHGARRRTT